MDLQQEIDKLKLEREALAKEIAQLEAQYLPLHRDCANKRQRLQQVPLLIERLEARIQQQQLLSDFELQPGVLQEDEVEIVSTTVMQYMVRKLWRDELQGLLRRVELTRAQYPTWRLITLDYSGCRKDYCTYDLTYSTPEGHTFKEMCVSPSYLS